MLKTRAAFDTHPGGDTAGARTCACTSRKGENEKSGLVGDFINILANVRHETSLIRNFFLLFVIFHVLSDI